MQSHYSHPILPHYRSCLNRLDISFTHLFDTLHTLILLYLDYYSSPIDILIPFGPAAKYC